MPVYDVQCVKCEKEYEITKKLDEDLPKCNTCKGEIEIMFKSRPVVKLKGAGFHCNDYDAIGPHEY